MRRSRRRRRPPVMGGGKPSRPLPRILIAIAVVLALVMFIDSRLRPVVESMAAYQVKVFASRTVNAALLQELEELGLSYDDVVKITRKKDGTVASIQTDMVTVNRLKSHMTQAIVEDLEEMDQRSIRVPIGTLIGNEWVSGRGPKVEIKVLPVGYVQADLYNQFSTAGINQTLHQVMLKVNIQMTAIVPGYTITTDTVTNFCIGETVIVGSIPDGFTQIEGDTSPLISKINDYRADE